jgi:CheY-like chemotaxis protein
MKTDVHNEGAPPGAATAMATASGRDTSMPASTVHVLVVDDERELCAIARAWLESLGYAVSVAHCAADAVARLDTEHFDFLFTDVVMPGGMDGLDLARQAKRQCPHLRVLLTTGYADVLRNTGDLPGSVLGKPYRKQNLATMLAAACARPGDGGQCGFHGGTPT